MRNILEMLEETAARLPEKTAVADAEGRYTFAELTRLARRIGASVGDKAGRPVGVLAERSVDTLAFFLGALYSGGYYVPLDPDMPAEKLRAILAETGLDVVLGPEEGRARLAELGYSGAYRAMGEIGAEECALPDAGDDDPLCLVYTSGSTGRPKGILKSHRAMCSYIGAFCDTFAVTGADVVGNQTPFFFDASAKDIYLSLRLGCTLELLPTKLFSFPTELVEYLNARGVTCISWVPTAFSIVAQLNPFPLVKPEKLRWAFFVGEVMPMKHLNRWRAALPDVRYVNLYGQSELAGVCCYYEVRGAFADSDTLPIGRPLANCRVRLLDEQGGLIAEPGRVGEIHIASEALALGYFHDPEKTAASFLTRDLGDGPVRCFRTGDLAQLDAHGDLVFAARADFQIKHMGHRIELGEIEAVAGGLSEIGRCCCLYNAARQAIVLFCELEAGVSRTGAELRSRLRGLLSDYMLPRRVVVLDKLPLNANGKVDRQALKALM